MNICTEHLVGIFLELVKINAVSKEEKPVADFIRKFLKKLNIDCQEDAAGALVGGNTGNIIAKIPGNKSRYACALVSHMDTVKSTSGIKPQVNDGIIATDKSTILGADNRAGIAIILYLTEYLIKNKIGHHPYEVIFTIGEETGLHGSQNLDMSMVTAGTAYILDSSASPGYFVKSAPQAQEFQIKFIGKASHAAVNPGEGINALSMAADFINKIPVGQVDKQTTVNFGKICGGEANNVVPGKVEMSGEIRSFSNSKINFYLAEIKKSLGNIADQYKGSFQFRDTEAFPGFKLDLEKDAVKILQKSFDKTGITPYPIPYHGGSDANILNNRGLFAINLGIGAKNPHSVNEFIKICDMDNMTKVMFHTLTSE